MRKMWVSIIRPHLDYFSQLWAPTEGPLMDKLEKLQYFYTGLIPELRNLPYEERLNRMKLSSLQRRYDRYRIFYVWKIAHNLVPNCGIKVASKSGTRQGLKYMIPKTPENRKGTLKDKSFQSIGPRCWNALPIYIRNNTETEFSSFKKECDEYLRTVKDQPRVGYNCYAKNSNYDIVI